MFKAAVPLFVARAALIKSRGPAGVATGHAGMMAGRASPPAVFYQATIGGWMMPMPVVGSSDARGWRAPVGIAGSGIEPDPTLAGGTPAPLDQITHAAGSLRAGS